MDISLSKCSSEPSRLGKRNLICSDSHSVHKRFANRIEQMRRDFLTPKDWIDPHLSYTNNGFPLVVHTTHDVFSVLLLLAPRCRCFRHGVTAFDRVGDDTCAHTSIFDRDKEPAIPQTILGHIPESFIHHDLDLFQFVAMLQTRRGRGIARDFNDSVYAWTT